MPIKKNIVKVMLSSVILEVILVCLFILFGNFNGLGTFVASSAGIIFGYTLPCLLYVRIWDNKKYRVIIILGAILAFTAALISVLALWGIIPTNITFIKTIGILNVIIWMLAIISWVLSYMIQSKAFKLFRMVFAISLIILSICISIMIFVGDIPSGMLLRLCLLLLAVTIGSFICVLILIKTNKKESNKFEGKE